MNCCLVTKFGVIKCVRTGDMSGKPRRDEKFGNFGWNASGKETTWVGGLNRKYEIQSSY
jgi:hypothetical protein